MAQRDERAGARLETGTRLPPGQYVPRDWPVLHYGPVPRFRPHTWDLRVFGATASGRDRRWDHAGFAGLPRVRVVADFHCVTRFSVLGNVWEGVATAAVLAATAPARDVTPVLVWAEYGYSANLRLADFASDRALLATSCNADRRGFWEERGYHNAADPWREQRYSYQELPGEGPGL
jgi:DMSO/TMAO reductase YedYZ molybdopterin-dependent catalytic subunit